MRPARRRRLTVTITVTITVIVLAISALVRGHSSNSPANGSSPATLGAELSASSPRAIPAAEAGVLPWTLAAPISREVVLPGLQAGSVTIVGGLSASGTSDAGIYSMSLTTGSLQLAGSLSSPTHDAAGSSISGVRIVVGGGSATPSRLSQTFSASATAGPSGELPEARADATAVAIGRTSYIVGGYNGPSFDPAVLATNDGVHFHAVATLRVPVRYAAVAVDNGRIYVFGGQDAGGRAVSTVEEIDPTVGTATVIGSLPAPLVGAVAANVGGFVYLVGGSTSASTTAPSRTIYAFDAPHRRFLRAGTLQVPVAYAGATVSSGRLWIVGGETAAGATASVQAVWPNRRFGLAGSANAGSPYVGERLLVADRGNDRLLVLNDAGRIIWQFPGPGLPSPTGGFYFPDDAFFARRGSLIISNQEANETIVEIAYPSGKIVWSYGHPRTPGAAPGYLNNPDDAYLLRNGNIAVADPKNCRVLVITPAKKVIDQLGTNGSCIHNPPSQLGSPNGDTPLADGNFLISEINGSWIDEYTPTGHLVWTVHLPIGYPSDPQQIGPDLYLVADYENPGAILEFNRAGQILYEYRPTSGPGMLNQPSLVEMLPSGVFMLNDDYNDRLVAIDPATRAVVWQYGVTGVSGTQPGSLNTPDGFDVIDQNGKTPTHAFTG